MIRTKRVYEDINSNDGTRVLVDRMWPRGLKKEDALVDQWVRDVAPSKGLRKWFAHDPKKWQEFKQRYTEELEKKTDKWKPLLDSARTGDIVLLYSAADVKHNNALALKKFLDKKLKEF